MKAELIRKATYSLMAAAMAFASPLGAVQLSTRGEGDALVFPIWTTTNGHLSVLSVVDSQSQRRIFGPPTQAVKVLLRDSQGQLLFGANLYMRTREDSWTASIVSLPDGRSRLASSDDSCVLVDDQGTAAPWSGSIDLDADHGFIEFIVMATIPNVAFGNSCGELAERWNTGVWSQDPSADLHESNTGAALRGSLNLVNVQKGTAYTIPATALREFSNIAQHTAPSSASPDLASAHDSGTAEGATRSRTCDVEQCLEDTWASPRDAVAAALMAASLRGEYSNSPTLNGKSDLVFTYPLRHHFVEDQVTQLDSARLYLSTFDRSAQRVGGIPHVCPGEPAQGCHPYWSLHHLGSVAVLSFPDVYGPDSLQSSAVLGIEVLHMIWVLPPAAEGAFRGFYGGALVSNSGRRHFGVPVIGVVLQQFENGNLVGDDGVQQRANYGVAVPMARQVTQ